MNKTMIIIGLVMASCGTVGLMAAGTYNSPYLGILCGVLNMVGIIIAGAEVLTEEVTNEHT